MGTNPPNESLVLSKLPPEAKCWWNGWSVRFLNDVTIFLGFRCLTFFGFGKRVAVLRTLQSATSITSSLILTIRVVRWSMSRIVGPTKKFWSISIGRSINSFLYGFAADPIHSKSGRVNLICIRDSVELPKTLRACVEIIKILHKRVWVKYIRKTEIVNNIINKTYQ